MAKLTKEELKNKINEKITDGELSIELLEDIEDSMNENDYSEEVNELQTKYDELQTKYKERFLSKIEHEEEHVEDEIPTEVVYEKNDIFEDGE